MSKMADAPAALSRNLHEAIKRVRDDVEEVEFWADAMSGFSQPIPGYDPGQAKVWVPSEQAAALKSDRKSAADGTGSSKPAGRGSVDDENPRG